MYVCICICMYVCMYIYIYIYICTASLVSICLSIHPIDRHISIVSIPRREYFYILSTYIYIYIYNLRTYIAYTDTQYSHIYALSAHF